MTSRTPPEASLRQLPADEYPHLAEHVHQHLTHDEIESGSFEFGLEQLLGGIEGLRAEQVDGVAGGATP